MEQITITLTYEEMVELNAARDACYAYMSPLPCNDAFKKNASLRREALSKSHGRSRIK